MPVNLQKGQKVSLSKSAPGLTKFNAIGSGFQGGLHALCLNFGVNV